MKIAYLFLSRSLAPVMFDTRVLWLAFYCICTKHFHFIDVQNLYFVVQILAFVISEVIIRKNLAETVNI